MKYPEVPGYHDHGDEDPTARHEMYWLAVLRPLNSGQHLCPNAYGYPFGHGLVGHHAGELTVQQTERADDLTVLDGLS